MKKLFTILLGTILVLNLNAQSEGGNTIPIVEYEISAVGYSNALPLPNPHFIGVYSLGAEVVLSFGGVTLGVTTVTCIDSALTNNFKNDSLATYTMYPMSEAQQDSMTLPDMINDIFEQRLRDIYGASNVTKIE